MFLGLMAIISLFYLLLRRYYRRSGARRDALRAITQLQHRYRCGESQQPLLADLSHILRKTAVRRFPDQNIAGVFDERWLAFLDETQSVDKDFHLVQTFHPGLLTGPYIPYNTLSDAELQRLLQLSKRWLAENA